MKRALVLLLLLVLALMPTPAHASHGMVTLPECGVREWSADLVKGRTGSVVVSVEHTVGCKTYRYRNYVGADREDQGSARETAWQLAECQRVGKLDTVRLFDYGWHTTVNPDDVRVSCTRYSGPD